ncbi:FeoA family protein [Cellulomonas bogoriensis]|uniref:FeoA family protein n=1 Tax=Cellulomonas bogoriensis 69B4 = DSM 16987 TaxID=1386082 RepID=A0A0A0BXZ5_9CELL|nr:ferrous iron transport protein A [Cellulomonas bogoriensis]KGM12835.1 FeoA family protein [Cellulomonas bogoriensis 69B4 = DSM 16987]
MDLLTCPLTTPVRVVRTGEAPALRLEELGVRPGTTVQVVQRTPFGGRVLAVGADRIAVDRATALMVTVAAQP